MNNSIKDRNLEEVTTLSLLEVSAQTLQILDSEGRNKFKSGFYYIAIKAEVPIILMSMDYKNKTSK